MYERHETYNYLSHKFNIAGEWSAQVDEIVSEYTTRLDLIHSSPCPSTLTQLYYARARVIQAERTTCRRLGRPLRTQRLLGQWSVMTASVARTLRVISSPMDGDVAPVAQVI